MISHHIGLNPEGYIDPEQCVSKGTALYAGVLNGNVKDMLLLDVLQIPISIGDHDGNCEVIIPKNTTIPVIEKKKFLITCNHQKEIKFRFFEGESDRVFDNIYLGELILTGIPPKGVTQVNIIVDIDANGIIHATAKDSVSQERNFSSTIVFVSFESGAS